MTVLTHSLDVLVTPSAPPQASSAAVPPRYVLHQESGELVDTVISQRVLTFFSAADSALMASIVRHANAYGAQQQQLEALREELIAHYANQVAALAPQEVVEAHALLPLDSAALP